MPRNPSVAARGIDGLQARPDKRKSRLLFVFNSLALF